MTDTKTKHICQNKRADDIAPSLGARERRDEERAIFLLAHLPPAPHRKQKQVTEAVIGRIAPPGQAVVAALS